MAATTAAVSVTSAAFAALSAGEATVMAYAEQAPARIAISTSVPDADSDDWFPLAAGSQLLMQNLGASDNVYARADSAQSGSQIVRVMKA